MAKALIVAQHFNSRPSARGDLRGFAKLIATRQFQFTPLREGRLSDKMGALWNDYFNSRPSARGDFTVKELMLNLLISIHAPPRGATTKRFEQQVKATYFNSRPSARGDAKDMQFLQIFCSTLTNQHGLTIVPRNLSRLFW